MYQIDLCYTGNPFSVNLDYLQWWVFAILYYILYIMIFYILVHTQITYFYLLPDHSTLGYLFR